MTRTAARPDPRFVESLRRTLLAGRDFRLEQLDQLDRQRSGRVRSSAHREIYVSLAVGARAALQDIDAVHIISHGEAGTLHLGADRVDTNTLRSFAADIRAWGESLNAGVAAGVALAEVARLRRMAQDRPNN